MAYRIDSYRESSPVENLGDGWYMAKPCVGPFLWRLKDAWGVLTGRYGAHSYESEERKRKDTK